jgi:putative methionine-R-sulfoxide reductase with GAF domain
MTVGYFCRNLAGQDTNVRETSPGADQLSTGRTSAVTYSCARNCLPSTFLIVRRESSKMQRSLTVADVNFVSLQTAVFCVQCEMLSDNNTPRCLACGSAAVLSLSRVLGGSLRGQQTAHLIADAELDRLVRSLLHTVPQVAEADENQDEYRIDENQIELPAAASFSSRHRMRPRHHGPVAIPHTLINAGEIDLEPGISIIAEKAQALTGATGAAIALRRGNEIVCRARTGRTAPDVGVRLQTDSGLSAECVRTGEVLLCNDAESNPRVDWESCRRMGVRSILVAPLRHFRRTLGVFEVLSSTPHAFDNNDVATMQFLSGMMVATISRLSSLQQFSVPSGQFSVPTSR